MRRKTQRSLVQIALFSGVLLLLLYFNRPQSNKSFAWTRIHYRTTSTTLPGTRGICPGLAGGLKPALVVARVASDGDPNWLDALADLYHLCIYKADAPADTSSKDLQVPANRGHEAMAYLTFLIDNYADIPAAGAVFVHGSRWAWHNDAPDYDNAAPLATLNVSEALAPWGYHNLRCDWSAGTCKPSAAPPQGSLETTLRSVLEPWDPRVVSDAVLPGALVALFGSVEHAKALGAGSLHLGRSHTVRSQCCAQFVVARERVWQHSREEYIALRQWLLDGNADHGTDARLQKSNAAPSDDQVAGRILSYVWHILFLDHGESDAPDSPHSADRGIDLERLNKMACPRADECYCRLYGCCNLEHCTGPGSCHGQYRLPQGLRLPGDWEATHS